MARTGYKITVYLDDNPNSPTYGETYTARTLDSGACPVSEDDLVLVGNQCEIDISGFTGYRILTYYNRTTGEYTEVREEDPECEPSTSEEQWVNSGSPVCETTEQGLNTGYMLQLQVQVNQNLPNYGATRYSRYKSPDCGSNGCASWNDIQTQCHIAVNDCVATFDGTEDVTQIDVNPLSETYNQTRTINRESTGNCQNCTETTFSWVDVGEMCGDDDMLCGEGLQQTPTTKYMVRQKYKTIGNSTPEPMGEYQITVVEEESEDCGYIRPITAWTATSEYVCDYETHNKYVLEVLMISYDSGVTWSVVEGETRRGDLIMEHSYDCGEPMYRWVPTDDYVCTFIASGENLTIVSNENNNVIRYINTYNGRRRTIYYSTDNGSTWNSYTSTNSSNPSICTLNRGEKVLIQGNLANTSSSNDDYTFFESTKSVDIYGNIMSLMSRNSFTELYTVSDYAFRLLFSGLKIRSAEYLVLPATTLGEHCYEYMFYECTSLTTAPSILPATTLADYCYDHMFYGCSGLTTTPSLPATTLAEECYGCMFSGCRSLTTAPELPATTLADGCYRYMFTGCTSITTTPELPATTLANSCYDSMFYSCTSLTTAPSILPATTLAESCYAGMFYGCRNLITAPELPATTLVNECYSSMFNGCTKLNYIKAMFTTTPSYMYTSSWTSGVASTGTFIKNSAATWNETGSYAVPTGWTVNVVNNIN